MSVHPFPMRKASAADLAEDQAKFAGCVIAMLEPDEAPMDDVLSCDLCHATEYDIYAIPGHHGPDQLCPNCAPDYADHKLLRTGTRLAELQLQRVRDHIDATEPDLFDMTPVYRGLFLAVAFAAGWAIAAVTLAFMLGAW